MRRSLTRTVTDRPSDARACQMGAWWAAPTHLRDVAKVEFLRKYHTHHEIKLPKFAPTGPDNAMILPHL
jgi:hypothetical protein